MLRHEGIEEVLLFTKPRKIARKASKRPKVKRKPKKRGKTKNPLKKARKDLWELCKQIIRKKYGNTCYTCGAKNLSAGNWQTGHFIPRSVCGLYLRYDLRNLRPQCYRCNISLGGNGTTFYRTLVDLEGLTYVDAIFADKKRETRENLAFYTEKIAQYREILTLLEK